MGRWKSELLGKNLSWVLVGESVLDYDYATTLFFYIQAWACYEFSMSIFQLISFIKYCITGFVLASGRSILCNGNCCVDGGGITFLCGKCLAQIVAIEKHPWWGYIVDNEWPRVSDRVQAVLFINFGVWSVTWCELVYE